MRRAKSKEKGSDLRAELWSFALSLYGRDEVAKACLVLQERLGADTDIILFALFAILRQGVSLDAEELKAVDAAVRDWREEIVKPLRRVRTRLKSGPSPAPSGATQALREQVKTLEIEAERIELDLLADWLAASGRRRAADTDIGTLLARLARHFAGEACASLDAPDVRSALRTLGASCARGTARRAHS